MLLVLVGVLLFLPREAHLSIYTSDTRYFDGFEASLMDQVGCATTHDRPTEETTAAANQAQREQLDRLASELMKAYAFYRTGEHPYKRFRNYLAPQLRWSPESLKERPAQVSLMLLGANLHVYLKPDTSPRIAEKLSYDFVLSQAFRPDFFQRQEFYTRPGYDFAFAVRESHDSLPRQGLEWLVSAAVRSPKSIAELAQPRPPAASDAQASADQSTVSFRAKVLRRVLDKKPYGTALIAEAKRSFESKGNLQFMLFFASDASRPELKQVLAALGNAELSEYYRPIAR